MKKVFAGNQSSMILCKNNQLLACGNNNYGKLGTCWSTYLHHLRELSFFTHKTEINDIQMGEDNTMVLLKNGDLYIMGKWNETQSKDQSALIVKLNVDVPIFSIHCSHVNATFQTYDKWYSLNSAFRTHEFNQMKITCEQVSFPHLKKLVGTVFGFVGLTKSNQVYEIREYSVHTPVFPNSRKWTCTKSQICNLEASVGNVYLFRTFSSFSFSHCFKDVHFSF